MSTYSAIVELPERVVTVPIVAFDEEEATKRVMNLCKELGWILPREVRILSITKKD